MLRYFDHDVLEPFFDKFNEEHPVEQATSFATRMGMFLAWVRITHNIELYYSPQKFSHYADLTDAEYVQFLLSRS